MESNAAWPYPIVQPLSRREFSVAPTETHLHPPASVPVFERLAEYLTPPYSLARSGQVARGHGYDTPGSPFLALRQRPAPDKLWAYRACAELIKHHSKSFYFSARLLPAAKRSAIMALYAFCRLSDDLVDEADAGGDTHAARLKARHDLDSWSRLCDEGSNPAHPVVHAWLDTRARYGIPRQLPEELLAGIRMDLSIDRYATWDDLWVYCYRVASTVGLMSMYITGTQTMKAVPYAVQLGVALQLTNILRDVGEDALSGRIYLPAEDMARFGYTEDMLLSGALNRNFVRLMQFEMARAHALYDSAWRGIAMLPADSRPAIAAAATLYRGILHKIVDLKYDVFNNRAHLSMGEKARSLPRVWWRARRMRNHTAQ
ncbi:MAG TPA: phytoene/squalene synthase family protein [Chloroflexia bacterium]